MMFIYTESISIYIGLCIENEKVNQNVMANLANIPKTSDVTFIRMQICLKHKE